MTAQSPAGDQQQTDEASDEDSQPEESLTLVERRPTDRWSVLVPAGLTTTGLGVIFSIPGLLLATGLVAGLLAYRGATTAPDPQLHVSRTIDPADPDPGDTVRIRTTITNEGDQTLPDIRCIEQLPEQLHVIEGSPRVGTGLSPGESCTIEYTVIAKRGTHEFGDLQVYVRDLASSVELEYQIGKPDQINCVPDPAPLPSVLLQSMTTPYTGRQNTNEAGEGIEFYGTRSYRESDSLRRVDWNKYAETGELVTRQFTSERRASVVLVADMRKAAFVAPDETTGDAARRSVDAIGQLFVSYLDANHAVGIATLGQQYWLAPTTGQRHRTRGITELGTAPELSEPAAGTTIVRPAIRRLLQRFPDHAQIIFCTPLVDRQAVTAVRLFEAYDHATTVLSPDPTTDTTPGTTLQRLHRQRRIDKLRKLGVPVVDWPAGTDLETVLATEYTGDAP